MAARNLLNGCEAAMLDVLHADSDSDIDCSDDESEQETVINDNTHGENFTAKLNPHSRAFGENLIRSERVKRNLTVQPGDI
jgi:hypothetical protein